jgi:hypothetical protein
MTRTSNARIAGATYLLYIVFGIASMAVFGRATAGGDVPAKLAAMALHATEVRIEIVLTLLCGVCAFILAVTLHALTREQDRDIAMLGLIFRVAEGIMGLFIARSLGLLWFATAANPPDAAAQSLAAHLFRSGAWSTGAWLFSLGSACFCWLLLRGRMIPAALAWLGVIASVLLAVVLPLELAGFIARANWLVWMPMLVFELTFAVWLMVKGAAPVHAEGVAGGL